MGLTAWIAGATGLVGRHVLRLVLDDADYVEVRAFGRRPPPLEHGKLRARVVDFGRLEAESPPSPDHVICCLGTTLRAAGSREAFRVVDHDYVVAFAELAQRAGANRFIAVSSLGADPASRVFYNRVKGEMEASASRVGLPEVFLLRPSLLLGARDERRPGEGLAQSLSRPLSPLFRGPLARYRPIEASAVARAAVRLGKDRVPAPGVHVLQSDRVFELGRA
ncbi:MAG TPA: NAD(P)H-binding protein [Polyangiaceae bacterium]|jgi:uncharacterized protein YbjT (DUF2867 family)